VTKFDQSQTASGVTMGPVAPPLQKVEVPEYINSIFLKYRLLQARINKAIGMNHDAHEICN